MFPCEYYENFRTPILKSICERLLPYSSSSGHRFLFIFDQNQRKILMSDIRLKWVKRRRESWANILIFPKCIKEMKVLLASTFLLYFPICSYIFFIVYLYTPPYFVKQTRTWTRTFQKTGPWTFRKSGPYTKSLCKLIKDHFWSQI